MNGKKTFSVAIWVKKRAPMNTQYHLIHGTINGNNELLLGGDHLIFNDSAVYIYNLRDHFVEDTWYIYYFFYYKLKISYLLKIIKLGYTLFIRYLILVFKFILMEN